MTFIDLCLFAAMMVGQTVVSYPSQHIQAPLTSSDSSKIIFRDEEPHESSKNSSENLPTSTYEDYRFYTRADWNAQPATDTRPLVTPTPYVIIHHTYIPGACHTPDECKAAMKSMQNYHMSLDWGDIGYKLSAVSVIVYALIWLTMKLNELPSPPEPDATTTPLPDRHMPPKIPQYQGFCVGSEGGVYEGRGWEVVGIHAGNANSRSVGICLIGDWRTELPPSQQIATTKALIETGVRKGIISPDYKLIGHRQARATECPGDALFNLIKTWEHFVPKYEPLTPKTVE